MEIRFSWLGNPVFMARNFFGYLLIRQIHWSNTGSNVAQCRQTDIVLPVGAGTEGIGIGRLLGVESACPVVAGFSITVWGGERHAPRGRQEDAPLGVLAARYAETRGAAERDLAPVALVDEVFPLLAARHAPRAAPQQRGGIVFGHELCERRCVGIAFKAIIGLCAVFRKALVVAVAITVGVPEVRVFGRSLCLGKISAFLLGTRCSKVGSSPEHSVGGVEADVAVSNGAFSSFVGISRIVLVAATRREETNAHDAEHKQVARKGFHKFPIFSKNTQNFQ